MFRIEMNISLDLHIAPQLHLSTMYNEEDIKPRYMYRNREDLDDIKHQSCLHGYASS